MTRPHVLHVAQPIHGGVAAYVAEVTRDQVERGWDVTVAAPAGGVLSALLADGVQRLTWDVGRSPGPSTLLEVRRLGALVRRARPELVHLHSAKAGLAGRLLLRGGLPTIYQPHGWSWLAARGSVAFLSRAWERHALRWTDLCVCVGEGERAQAVEAGLRGPLTVVRNGVDLARFTPASEADRASARRGLALRADAPLVVCPGRITRQKGQDVLLAAWPAVRREVPTAELALVGDGAPRGAAGVGVHLAGPVQDIRPWLAAADVVVFPSRWEGLSLGLLEAMAVGRSTVVSAIPGLLEATDPSVGAAVAPGQPGGLADAVVTRLCDPALVAAEGRAAAQRAIARFGIGDTLDRLAAAVLGVLGVGDSPAPEQLPDRPC